jgi:transcriptional regulator with XRE-family HTH domain
MTSGDSPAVARRRVRLALREARESEQRTQTEVADAMDWSLSKVIRIESGEVSISPNDLRPLLSYLNIKERPRIDELIADAKTSRQRQRQWWQEPRFREHLTPALSRLIEFEREAVAARHFAIYLAPGILQVPEFAEAILRKWHADRGPVDGLTEEEIAVRLEARARRREAFLARTDNPRVAVLVDESMVLRIIGGPDVLAAQLADMLRLINDGRITLRIVPFHSIEAPLPTFGTYDMLYLTEDGDDDNAVIYRELNLGDEIVEDRMRAELHRLRFDELWNASMDEQATIELVQKRLKDLGAARQT